ncbi:toxin YdaT domain-containing protein [Enterobacter bugandensis]|uniref:toxin YdaT domain-containing protein n=1 Tax=Enterobacter bugandensis TaxID=881260 RepID=UPI0021CED8E9|nr:toxin YdaT domain-containing protein [Enterobacter bugandensis]MCU6214469.1 toxin YdaT domain-containing protein [Enterobacter bugandensis]
MKIRPSLNDLAAELEAWALSAGWKTVAGRVAELYHQNGGGQLLPVPDSDTGLRNAVQRLRRIYRGEGRYAVMATQLQQHVLAAMPTEMRARLESPGDPIVLAANAAKESVEAINAVHLRAAPHYAIKEIDEAIAAFLTLKKSLPLRAQELVT